MQKYIKNKKDLIEFLQYESEKYGLKSKKYPFIAISENKQLYRFNYILRKYEYFFNNNIVLGKYLYKIKLINIQRKLGVYIYQNTFDKGLHLIHIGFRMVNGKANIGKNCDLHVNTCIVAGGTNDDTPQIGDDCIIGVGAVISGRAILGNNVAVGANAFVNKNFHEGNMTIAGVPAKKISDNTKFDWNKKARKEN